MNGWTDLQPNLADINGHLYALFPPAFVQAYPDATVEIVYGPPGVFTNSRWFSAFDLKSVAGFAEVRSANGDNVYVGAALRHGVVPISGRANAEDNFLASQFAWIEFDGAGDADRISAILLAKQLRPAILVTTGTVPHLRQHIYFEIDGGTADPGKLVAANRALQELLGSDNVIDPIRILRLAGTINYPSLKKQERGYVAELVTFMLDREPHRYTADQLASLAGATAATRQDGPEFRKPRSDDELYALLETSRISTKWHNSIRDAIASMIGRGWSDLQIRLACAQYCNGGANDPDLAVLIEGGRKKWNKPDADDEGDVEQVDLKEGEERGANQAPVSAVLPVIRITSRISELTTRAQEMLIHARVPFYQRGGELVRPIIRTVKAAHGRLTKTAQLKTIVPVFMRDTMCRHAHWERFDARKGGWLNTMAPLNVAATLLARDGVWGFPEIIGVIATPTMRPDGSLLIHQGYDAATALLLIEPPPMPEIPDQPTREDALRALALLEELVSESPFDDEASKSVALSGLITPVVRGAFSVAPMHVSSAPVAGSGKSFLWDLVAAISTGQQRIPVIAAGNEEETEKRLVGVMLSGQPLISIDNVNGELKGDFLCQAIEQHSLDIRPLGRSDIIRIQTSGVTIFATGNNITIVGDLCRRTIKVRLDAKLEDPQLRQYTKDPIGNILGDRGRYIAACLTICRAYKVAGRPGLLPRLASFEGWSDTVRSALVWLGKADAIDTMEGTRAEDPHRIMLSDLLHAWATCHGTGRGSDVPLSVIIEKSMMVEKMGGLETGEFKFPDLNAAVRAAASAGKGSSFGIKVDPLAFGIWCRQNKGRIVDGLRLANQPSNRGGAATWWVEKTAKNEEVPSGGPPRF